MKYVPINALSVLCLISTFAAMGMASNCAATEAAAAIKQHANNATYLLLNSDGKSTTADARCVTILQSGLTWELKTDDGGVHDQNHVYRWGGTGAEKSGTIFFDDWNKLLEASNSEKLCGFSDWRVPTIDELKTLVTVSNQKSTLDMEIFSLTQAAPYWSASTYQNYPEHAQTVDFATGASNYYNGFRGDRLPLRLVRGEKQ